MTKEIKVLDRQRKREFSKHNKSEKWQNLHEKYINLMQKSKVAYSKSIVNDLKSSNPSQWYSKVKRMSNINRVSDDDYFIEEFCDLNLQTQADQLVNFYASTRNQFQSISEDDFQSVFDNDLRQDKTDILTPPEQVE